MDSRSRLSRKLVLIDLENVLFGEHERLSESVIGAQTHQILKIAEARRPGDHLIVGCNPHLAFAAHDAFPHARLVTAKGKDGADAALVQQFDSVHAADRFSELCIISGDHAFADTARSARTAGLLVRVIAPRFGLSEMLRLNADLAVLLPNLAAGSADSEIRSGISAICRS